MKTTSTCLNKCTVPKILSMQISFFLVLKCCGSGFECYIFSCLGTFRYCLKFFFEKIEHGLTNFGIFSGVMMWIRKITWIRIWIKTSRSATLLVLHKSIVYLFLVLELKNHNNDKGRYPKAVLRIRIRYNPDPDLDPDPSKRTTFHFMANFFFKIFFQEKPNRS